MPIGEETRLDEIGRVAIKREPCEERMTADEQCGDESWGIVYFDNDGRHYYAMCKSHAQHSVRNRGARLLAWTTER